MKEVTFEDYRARILRVLVHIQQHLDETIPLEALAAVAHFSPFHFHRIFHGLVGEPVREHVRRLRLERAAHRLRHSGQTVTEIALGAGYETPESFSRAFHRMFDESPTEYRSMHRPAAFSPTPSGVHYAAGGAIDGFLPVQFDGSPLQVTVETLPGMRAAFVRHVGSYDETDAAYRVLMAWAGRRGLLGAETEVFGLAHDDPQVTPVERLRYDAALVVPPEVAPDGGIGIQVVPGGTYAVARHRGPYEDLGRTYTSLCGGWIPRSGRELSPGPALEFYRNTLRDTVPADLITDIAMRLAC